MIDFQNAKFNKLSQTGNDTFADKLAPMMVGGEEIIATYKANRDGVVFTNKRIFVVNVQGFTGKKVDFTSLPYSKIQSWSIETAGALDMDAELEIWFSGLGKVRLEFSDRVDIASISKHIASCVL